MGSKERVLRLKADTRRNILDKALCIMQSEGCDALSMRKLADRIDYTAPVIYGYFKNKDSIYQELTRKGFLILAKKIKRAKSCHADPESQIIAMWVAYWDFAFTDRLFYQMMYGVNVGCYQCDSKTPEAGLIQELMLPVITALYSGADVSTKEVQIKFFTYWSVIHGLIAINIVRRSAGDVINRQVLLDAINGINLSIKNS